MLLLGIQPITNFDTPAPNEAIPVVTNPSNIGQFAGIWLHAVIFKNHQEPFPPQHTNFCEEELQVWATPIVSLQNILSAETLLFIVGYLAKANIDVLAPNVILMATYPADLG